jgi:hypothetical protein
MLALWIIWFFLTLFIIGLAIARKIAARNEDDLVHLTVGAERAIPADCRCPEIGMVRSLGQDVDNSGWVVRCGFAGDHALHCLATKPIDGVEVESQMSVKAALR